MTASVLVLGASSYIGRHLFGRLGERALGTYAASPVPKAVRFDALSMRIADILHDRPRPSHAVVLLADTDPDSCAADVARSEALNVTATVRLIDDLLALGIVPVFTSTEFVFDGTRGEYVEDDPVGPILTYGRQKVAVERHLAATGAPHAVLRLAKVYGTRLGDGTVFTSWVSRLARGERAIACAADQAFSPVLVDEVVEAIVRAVDRDLRGLYHLAGPRRYRRIELLEMLVAEARRWTPIDVTIEPRSLHDFPLRERRPLDVSMRPDRLAAALDLPFTDAAAACSAIAAAAFGRRPAAV